MRVEESILELTFLTPVFVSEEKKRKQERKRKGKEKRKKRKEKIENGI